jgi:membrane associated rhomboid family serine protease
LVAWRVTGLFPTEATLEGVWWSREALQAGEWHRLLTSIVAHGGLLHLVFNGLALVSLASVEREIGTLRYAVVFVGAGVGGNLAHALASTTPAVGASGAIFGLLGVLVALAPGARLSLLGLPVPAAILLPAYAAVVVFVPGLEQLAPIAHWAHLGGLAVGVLAGVGFEPARAAEHLAYAALAFVAVAVIVVNLQTVGVTTLVQATLDEGLGRVLAAAGPTLVALGVLGATAARLPDPRTDETVKGATGGPEP